MITFSLALWLAS